MPYCWRWWPRGTAVVLGDEIASVGERALSGIRGDDEAPPEEETAPERDRIGDIPP